MKKMLTRAPLLALAALALAATFAACDGGGAGDEPGQDFDRAAMLQTYGAEVILPAYQALADATADLDAAAQAFADAPSASTLAPVRADLKAARLAWQDASFFQFGPASAAGLNSALNSYPADADVIEDNLASGDYRLGSAADLDAGGFPAIAYLLYDGATDADVVAAFAGEAGRARRAYLAANTAFVRQRAEQVRAQWSPEGGAYLGQFASEANAGTDVGSSMGMLINAFVQHYERSTRDGKIGIPAGVRTNGIKRPTATEAVHGGYSAELAQANLRALRRLYRGDGLTGASGTGLDDHLAALDAAALDAEIETAFDEAASAVAALSDPLAQQIETDNDPVLDAFQEMQELVVLLKADMTSILGVTITFQDNDGD